MRLSEFNYKIAYKLGNDMLVADCLSRTPRNVTLSEEEAMCLAIQTSINAMDFEDSDSVGGNTGHIATAFND